MAARRSQKAKHTWTFARRFRRNAFGWRSAPAVKRIREAVTEIKKEARKDPVLGGEGAVLFLERLAPAIEHVDSSSGSMGTTVNRAIRDLVPVIASAPADPVTREEWLERLWEAFQEDEMPYLEKLGDHWGELCADAEVASRWGERLLSTLRLAWSPDPELRGFFKGGVACLSALFAAGRYEEVLGILESCPHLFWCYRRWGVLALAAQGKVDEALRYAEPPPELLNDHGDDDLAEVCERILLDAGREEEAYQRYARGANARGTHAATFRAIARKYPGRDPSTILRDLIAGSPGDEGRWFAAAKDLGLYELAVELANRSPCAHKTLTRAARDFEELRPAFAMECALAALRWILLGHSYEVTGLDVHRALDHAEKAARSLGRWEEARARLSALLEGDGEGNLFARDMVSRRLERAEA